MPEHYTDTEMDEAGGRAAEERTGLRESRRASSNRWRFDDAVQAARYLGSVTR
jgi:hypothetical protein